MFYAHEPESLSITLWLPWCDTETATGKDCASAIVCKNHVNSGFAEDKQLTFERISCYEKGSKTVELEKFGKNTNKNTDKTYI